MSGDIFHCQNWEKRNMLVVSSEQRPGMLPDILQCTGQTSATHTHTHTQSIFHPEMSVVEETLL